MPEQFVISDRCPPEQRKAFEAINRGLEKLGVSADEFDQYFRFQLISACVSVAQSAPTELVAKLGTAAQIQIFGTKERYAKAQKSLKNLNGSLAVELELKHRLSHPEDIRRVIDVVQEELVPKLATQSAKVLNGAFGRFQDLDRQSLTPRQIEIVDYYKKTVSDDVKPSRPIKPYDNLLQKCAEGAPLMHAERITVQTSGMDFKIPTIGDYTALAIANAIDRIVYDKGFNTEERRKELKNVLEDIALSMHDLMNKSFASVAAEKDSTAAQQPQTPAIAPPATEQPSIPFYTLDESKRVAPQPMTAETLKAWNPIQDLGALFLTPACIHRAQATGEYRLVTFTEACKEFAAADADSPSSLSYIMSSYFPNSKEQGNIADFKRLLQHKQQSMHHTGASYRLPDGRLLDMNRYFATADADAEKWVAAYNKQESILRQESIQKARTTKGFKRYDNVDKQFAEAFATQIDENARAVIARGNVTLLLDFFHEMKSDITINQSQKVIIIHPEFLTKKGAMGIIREQALLCVLDETQEDIDLSAAAKKEVEQKYDDLPSRWKQGAQTPGSVIYARAKQEPELFRTLLPVTWEAERQYESKITAQAYQVMHDKPMPEFKASDTAFTVNPNALTSAQQAYFGQLNKIIAELGVTPKEFDTQFRCCAGQIRTILNAEIQYKSGDPVLNSEHFSAVRSAYESIQKGDLDHPQKMPKNTIVPTALPTTNFRNKSRAAEMKAKLAELEHAFGFMNWDLPIAALPHEIRLANSMAGAKATGDEIQPDIGTEDKKKTVFSTTPDITKEENILQSYASGKRQLSRLPQVKELGFVANGQSFDFPSSPELFNAAIHNASLYLAKKKDFSSEKTDTLRKELDTIYELSQSIFIGPDELGKSAGLERAAKDRSAARAAEEERRAAADAQRKAAEEAARLKREAEEAEKPLPYVIPIAEGTAFARIVKECARAEQQHWKGIKNNEAREEQRQLNERMRYLRREEIEPLTTLINAKLPEQKELADVLFADSSLRRAEFACKSLAANGKVPQHPERFSLTAGDALMNFFAQDTASLQERDRLRHDQIQQRILESPTLLIAALGDDNQLRELREIHQRLLANDMLSDGERAVLKSKRLKIAYGLLDSIGIETPALPAVQPVLATAPTETVPPLPPVHIPEATHLDAAQAHEQQAYEHGEQETGHFPAISHNSDGVALFTPITLADTPVAPIHPIVDLASTRPAQTALHEKTMEEAKQILLREIDAPILMAQDQGYNFFECKVDVRNPKLPIVFQFSKEEIDRSGNPHRSLMKYEFPQPATHFTKNGLTLTLEDATDLKIAVQGAVLEKAEFMPPLFTRKSGVTDVSYNALLPKNTYDDTLHERQNIVEGSGGLCSLEIVVKKEHQHKKGEDNLLYITIPLGIARKPGTPSEQKAVESEIEERVLKVLSDLDTLHQEHVKTGKFVSITKGDLVESLKRNVSDREQVWEKWERDKFPGFEQPELLHLGPGEKGQKITLAPVTLSLEAGGDNPSWHMNLRFYVGDKDKKSMGTVVRGHALNLHTRDADLARARAFSSLMVSHTTLSGITRNGILPTLQDYMREHPNDQWSSDPNAPVMIGQDKPLQHFFDDMKRYEHDVNLHVRTADPKDGKVEITFTATRSNEGASPEILYIKRESGDRARVPMEVHFSIPQEWIATAEGQERIREFTDSVKFGFSYNTWDHYSSEAITDKGHKRQDVPKYNTLRIKNTMVQAIEKDYAAYFGQSLPKDWVNEGASWVNMVDGERVRRTRASKKKPADNHVARITERPHMTQNRGDA
jgi:hypothetical protein